MIIITNLENVTFIQWDTNHKFREAYKRKRLPGYNFKRHPKPPNQNLKKQYFCTHDNYKRFIRFTLQPKSPSEPC